MFSNITVLSRQDMIEASSTLDRDCLVISISDKGDEAPALADNSHIKEVAHLFFDDAENEEAGGMTRADAQRIADAVSRWANANLDLFIHCGAGVSRSAGTAAAAMLWQWGDDSDIFNNGKYSPNMHCYRYVLDAARLEYDDIQLARKEREQYLLWREENKELFE